MNNLADPGNTANQKQRQMAVTAYFKCKQLLTVTAQALHLHLESEVF